MFDEGIPRRFSAMVRGDVSKWVTAMTHPLSPPPHTSATIYIVTHKNITRVIHNHDLRIDLFLVSGRGGMDEFAILNREFGMTLRSVWN